MGGTLPVREVMALLEQAGFTAVEYRGTSGIRTSRYTESALVCARRGEA